MGMEGKGIYLPWEQVGLSQTNKFDKHTEPAHALQEPA